MAGPRANFQDGGTANVLKDARQRLFFEFINKRSKGRSKPCLIRRGGSGKSLYTRVGVTRLHP
jgi:hypothetical protein